MSSSALPVNLNRIEAIREMNVAETLMLSEDYIGARDKLLKAKQLYPQLHDIGPALTVCDILVSANILKLPGLSMTDHYWVLQLTPSSTSSDVNSRYKKLVPILQAIKNKFPGTDLALELVHSAYNVLSDREKHSEFDSRRKKTWEGYETQIDRASRSGDSGFNKVAACLDIDQEHDDLSDQDFGTREAIQEFYDFEQNRKAGDFEAGQVWAVHHSYQAHGVRNFWYALILAKSGDELEVARLKPVLFTETDRRNWHEGNLNVSCGSFNLDTERIEGQVSPKIFSYKCSNWDLDMVGEDDRFEKYPKKGEIWAALKNCDLEGPASNGKFTIVEMVTEFSAHSGASCVHLVMFDGFRSVFKRLTDGEGGGPVTFHIPAKKLPIFSHNIPAHRLIGGDIDDGVNAVFELDQLALPGNVIRDLKTHYLIEEKQNWSGDDLAAGQVWAVYCGENGMPQQYARIDKVISETQVIVTYLEPGPVLDPESSPVTCGVFRLGEISATLEISEFSHLVQVQQCQAKSEELCCTIYPRKGEVWAMYKNWNGKWKQSDYKNRPCLVMEILSEFSDGNGIRIARLGEVEGCLTFFRRQQQNGFELVRVVPESEMPSFSHRIPAFLVPGSESYGIPEGSWHLEPSALPINSISG